MHAAFRVLSVDDDPAMRAHLKSVLLEGGIDVEEDRFVEAKDGVEGYRELTRMHLAGRPPSLIVSDWEMPRMTGVDFLRRVRSDPRFKQSPFILATGVSQQGAVVDAIKSGVSSYVVKPYEREAFMSKVSALLPKIQDFEAELAAHPADSAPRRWLVVDALGANRNNMVGVLKSLGFTEWVEAVGSNDAMERVTQFRAQGGFYGVLCNIKYCGDQNSGLLSHCHSRDRWDARAFFIVCSEKEVQSDERVLVDAGIDGQLVFPFAGPALAHAIGQST